MSGLLLLLLFCFSLRRVLVITPPSFASKKSSVLLLVYPQSLNAALAWNIYLPPWQWQPDRLLVASKHPPVSQSPTHINRHGNPITSSASSSSCKHTHRETEREELLLLHALSQEMSPVPPEMMMPLHQFPDLIPYAMLFLVLLLLLSPQPQ